MRLNYKKLSIYFLIMILGMSFITFGLMNIAYDLQNTEMSEQEIITRAKDLGLVEIKETLENNE